MTMPLACAVWGAPPRLLAARSRADPRLPHAVFHQPTALFTGAGRFFPFNAIMGYYNKEREKMQGLVTCTQLRAASIYDTINLLFNGWANARKLLPLEYKSGR